MDTISADRPILSTDQDALGRSTFAKKVSKGIIQLPASNGFVLGLTGKWGTGKSSTIEMILEWITKDNELFAVFSASLRRMVPKAYNDLAEHLGDAWFYVISDFVTTPRDAARIVNKFLFLYSALFEITDPVDLLILIVVDVMDPDLYRWIQEDQVSLSRGSDKRSEYRDFDYKASSSQDKEESRLDKIAKLSGTRSVELTRIRTRLLEFLFPNVFEEKTIVGLSRRTTHHVIEKVANTGSYFKLSEANISWPRSLLERFNEQSDYIKIFEAIIGPISASPEQGQGLLRIRIIEEMYQWIILPNFNIYNWLDAVLLNAPYFIRSEDEINWDDNFRRIYQLITTAIKQNELIDYSRLFSMFAEERYDFTLPSVFTWRLLGSKNPKSEYVSNYRLDADFSHYRAILIERCEVLFRSKELFEQADPSRILAAWWGVSDTGLNEEEFEGLIRKNMYPRVFFELDVTRSTGGDFIRPDSKQVLNADKIHEMAVRVLSDESFDREDKLAAQVYIERYRRGLEERW